MKKKLLLFLTLLLLPIITNAAGSATASVPASTTTGSNVTFTVTLKNTAAWNVTLNGTGATSNCSSKFADVTANGLNTTKNLTLTCKANNEGTITFTATGDITSEDGNNSNVSISKTVTVTKPREKETESRLSSLSVKGYNINFNQDTDTYNISVEPSVNSIEINAKALGAHASISGTGVKKITDDYNTFNVVVTAENGTQKTYKINVSVKDSNPINITINDEEYKVIKSNKSLKAPTNFKETTVEINNTTIPAFTNTDIEMTIIGLMDKNGTIKYAVYNNGYYNIFNTVTSPSLNLYIEENKLDNYEETTIEIDNNTYKAYKYNDRYSIIYAKDLNTGISNYYKYDKEGKTFQIYEIEENKECKTEVKKESKSNNTIYIVIIIILTISTIALASYIIYTKVSK